jgi:hypothetical protein
MKSILWAFIFEWLKQWHLFHALELSVIRLAGLKALGTTAAFLKILSNAAFLAAFFQKVPLGVTLMSTVTRLG